MARTAETSTIWRRIPVLALTTAVTLVIAGLALASYTEHAYRTQRIDRLEAQARILAATVTAALAFEDRAAAQEYVNALSANPEIQAAVIYDENGSLFVAYTRPSVTPAPLSLKDPPPLAGGRYLLVTAPVIQGEAILGTVRLQIIAESFARRVQRYGGIILLVTMASLVVLVLGAAHTARSRANAELRKQAAALSDAYAKLQAESAERQRAEEALRQTQKMEAIGQLSGGVAHDFNNLLQALSGCLRLIERKAADAAIQPLIEAGRQAVDRGTKLTQQLMAFARRQALRPEPVDVADCLLGMSELLARALRADITLEVDIEPGLWPIEVDPTQLELAILNLAVNARDAMPKGGRLRIQGRNISLGPDQEAPGPTGDVVQLTLSDTGEGMSREVLSHAFEPFFTTKGVGKGTGLGLSQVYGFSRQSGGVVDIDSAPGRGTSVSLILPRCHATPEKQAQRKVPSVGEGAGGRVLLVEDDPVVGNVMTAAVEDLGYRVTRAFSGDEGLARIERGDPFDVLFSDVVMPGAMNGLDLAREARRRRPGLAILLTSGYNEGTAVGREFPLLAKPYRIEALAEALAHVIDAARGNAEADIATGKAPTDPDRA